MPHSITIKQTTLDLIEGDITQQSTDAIVNAANSALAGGGGVDGAIHRAAGWQALQAELKQYNGCTTGEAVITSGLKLPARYIIHAVGPRYRQPDAPALLASAYRRSLEVASENGLTSIAFPAISTGVYGYPMAEAAAIALATCRDYAAAHTDITLMRFVLFGADAYAVFERALGAIA